MTGTVEVDFLGCSWVEQVPQRCAPWTLMAAVLPSIGSADLINVVLIVFKGRAKKR